jgi:hypothetical protein
VTTISQVGRKISGVIDSKENGDPSLLFYASAPTPRALRADARAEVRAHSTKQLLKVKVVFPMSSCEQ